MSASGPPDDGSGFGIHPGSPPFRGVGVVCEPDDGVRGNIGPICTASYDSAWLGPNRRSSTKRSEDEHRDIRLGANLKILVLLWKSVCPGPTTNWGLLREVVQRNPVPIGSESAVPWRRQARMEM